MYVVHVYSKPVVRSTDSRAQQCRTVCVCVLVVICDEFDVRVNSHFMYVRFYIIYVLFHDDKGNRKAATTQ